VLLISERFIARVSAGTASIAIEDMCRHASCVCVSLSVSPEKALAPELPFLEYEGGKGWVGIFRAAVTI
jgi:hypothetical protein